MTVVLALFFSVFFWGCSTLEYSDSGSDTQLFPRMGPKTQTQPAAAPEVPTPAASVATTSTEPITAETKLPTKEEIRLLQALLRDAGFDPGPVDGDLGAKTRAALGRLQSACSALDDLLGGLAAESVRKTGTAQSRTAAGSSDKRLSTAEIRLLQVRLKEAGLDPGPIDGKLGARTKAALARLESGCAIQQAPWFTLTR